MGFFIFGFSLSLILSQKTKLTLSHKRIYATFFFFAEVSFIKEETNITQDPGQDTRWAPHSGRESSTRGTGTETGVGGGVGSGVLAWEGGRGRCATSEEVRLDQWAGAGGYLAVAGLLSRMVWLC